MMLYGFLSQDDLNIFKLLLTVSGIGPKGALAILSAMSTDALRMAVISGDDHAIAKAPGIGKKTAQRLIIDLKDKLKFSDFDLYSQTDATDISQTFIEKDGNDFEMRVSLYLLQTMTTKKRSINNKWT